MDTVEDGFDNYVTVKNAYRSSEAALKDMRQDMEDAYQLNLLGELTYEEYKSTLDDYETQQNDFYDAMALYSETLNTYDRTTCGGITLLLKDANADLEAGEGGESFVSTEETDGATYYINPIVQNEEFVLGIQVPEDFEPAITDFELWCDSTQIGQRTSADKTLRHLALSTDNVIKVFIRLYNGGDFVADCEIDPEAYNGPLTIEKYSGKEDTGEQEVGTFEWDTDDTTGMIHLTLHPNADEGIAYYLLRDAEGTPIGTTDPIEVEKTFNYLGLLEDSIADITVSCYDTDQKELYKTTLKEKGSVMIKQ